MRPPFPDHPLPPCTPRARISARGGGWDFTPGCAHPPPLTSAPPARHVHVRMQAGAAAGVARLAMATEVDEWYPTTPSNRPSCAQRTYSAGRGRGRGFKPSRGQGLLKGRVATANTQELAEAHGNSRGTAPEAPGNTKKQPEAKRGTPQKHQELPAGSRKRR